MPAHKLWLRISVKAWIIKELNARIPFVSLHLNSGIELIGNKWLIMRISVQDEYCIKCLGCFFAVCSAVLLRNAKCNTPVVLMN